MLCLKTYLKRLERKQAYYELHSLSLHSAFTCTPIKYGPWFRRACVLLRNQKQLIKSNSKQLGTSFRFALEELEPLYREKAEEAEWRLDEWGPATKSEFLVKVRNCGLNVDPVVAWGDLAVCSPAENPNFHQVAGLLAYGPHALGKGQICPRDGLEDCSVVDALLKQNKSAKANWFFSWVWGYRLHTVLSALAEWRRRYCSMTGSNDHDIYLWWDLFVDNQFRILEEGQATADFFDVFTDSLQGIGRMIMCLDTIHESNYTCCIWTLFEVYIAIQQHIKITLAIPPDALDIDDICSQVGSLQDIFAFCRVNSAKAAASSRSSQADAEFLKRRILEEVGTFSFLNWTVEEFLVSEILQLLRSHNKASGFAVEVDQNQEDSRYFGVSLDFVLSEFKCMYRDKAPEAEWRLHDSCEVTEPGFIVKVRDCCDVESGVVAWGDLDVCRPPENPNFYQLAGLLAYGPHALGKGQICPRDGRADCSLVDALRKQNKSGQANWFLSWAWSYSLDVVRNALARWWDSHAAVVASEACPTGSVYLWWCFFVNNQFRMLEDGITQDTDSLLRVFAEPLERAGKVLMCMDNFQTLN